MRKIILLILIFCLGANTCFANLAFQVNNFPVKVYVPESQYSYMVKQAFSEWIYVSKNKISVEYISEIRKKAARISFVFVDYCSDKDKLGLAHTTYSGKYVIHTEIEIATRDFRTKKLLSNDQIYKTIVHEIGHAIGLDHSPNTKSIMYFQNLYPQIKQNITQEDIIEIRKMYRY